MRRKKRRRFCAKTYMYKNNRWHEANEEYKLWCAKECERNKTYYSLTYEEQDSFEIKETFLLWETIVETGRKPDRYGPRKADDCDRIIATAYLGFRPNHPQTVKYRRWFKRLDKKKNIYLLFCEAAGNFFYWNGDDYSAMAEYHTILKGLQRFIKANKLYKLESIRKGYSKMKAQFKRPKLYRKEYRRYMSVWHALADSKD